MYLFSKRLCVPNISATNISGSCGRKGFLVVGAICAVVSCSVEEGATLSMASAAIIVAAAAEAVGVSEGEAVLGVSVEVNVVTVVVVEEASGDTAVVLVVILLSEINTSVCVGKGVVLVVEGSVVGRLEGFFASADDTLTTNYIQS